MLQRGNIQFEEPSIYDDMVDLMKANEVVWHSNCRNSVNNQKVERAKKKEEDAWEKMSTPSPRKSRRTERSQESTESKQTCFFCDGEIKDNKRQVTNLDVDAKS